MAINEKLTGKIRAALLNVAHVEEKKMFSGIAFMVNDKLCIAVGNSRIMCRINPAVQDKLITEPGCNATVMKGKKMNGYVNIDESVLQTKKQIEYWVKFALDYNSQAKATVKKKRSIK